MQYPVYPRAVYPAPAPYQQPRPQPVAAAPRPQPRPASQPTVVQRVEVPPPAALGIRVEEPPATVEVPPPAKLGITVD